MMARKCIFFTLDLKRMREMIENRGKIKNKKVKMTILSSGLMNATLLE